MIKAAIERIMIGGRIWIDGYLRMENQATGITTRVPPEGSLHFYAKNDSGIRPAWRDDDDVEHLVSDTTGTGTDHGGLTGLADDDHPQYRLESADHSHQSTGLQGGQLDHGAALTGLGDNDHPQYALASGFANGVYTPTLTSVANLDATTAYQCQYMRVGSVVTVSGKLDANPTAIGSVQVGITLPVASDIGAIQDVGGVGFATAIAGQGAGIVGDLTNDRAQMEWIAVDVSNQSMAFTFTYRVI